VKCQLSSCREGGGATGVDLMSRAGGVLNELAAAIEHVEQVL
jgi:hypothetical protein